MSDHDDDAPLHGIRPGAPGEQAFVHGGEPRGVHELLERRGDVVYRARLCVRGDLPLLHLSHRSSNDAPPEAYGPEVTVGAWDFDRHFVARSASLSLPAKLFHHPALLEAVGGVVGYLERLELRPRDEGATLLVDIRVGHAATRLSDAVLFTAACLDAADAAVLEWRRLDDARAAVAILGDQATPEERVEALVRHVTEATHWLTGYAARVRDSVEARLVLADAGREHEGVLRLLWSEPAVAEVAVAFDGELPTTKLPLSLRPQPRGLLGLIASWGEQVVGDEPLDDAFVIRGELAAGPVLLRARGRFLELGHRGASVEIGEALSVRIDAVPSDVDLVVPTLEAVLEVWRSTARHGLGLE